MTELLRRVWCKWHNFWFSKEDPLAVCVMRWPMVGMIFYTHLIWTFDLEAFFSNQASWQSREFVSEYQIEQFAYSFWWYVPSQWMWTMHFVSLFILFLFWIGFAAPITGWLCFVIVVSYANRVPLAMYGLDQVNGIAALYLAIAPCGERLSVDAFVRRRLQIARDGAGLKRWILDVASRFSLWDSSPDFHSQPRSSARLAIRLFQVHLCFIYLWGGLGKLQGETWWNGEAIWLAAASLEYQSNDLTWLVYFPWLYQMLSIATWVWEISFAILIWQKRLRPFVLMVGVGMHLGIGMFMGMWTFGLAMIFIYLAFIPSETYRDIAMRMAALWYQWHGETGFVDTPAESRADDNAVYVESGGI